jgi:molybdenum cofactor biosynthesis enzyme MoaA
MLGCEVSDFHCIKPRVKSAANVMPFVTFPLTKKCNFRCKYCGYGGELSASMTDGQDLELLKNKIYTSYRLGVRKFRLTGGEPFLYPGIKSLIEMFNELGVFLLVNTNGSLVEKYKGIIESAQENIHFVVSLDTLKQNIFDELTGTKGMFKKVLNGIQIIKNARRLFRLNMVANKLNREEIFDIIAYCKELGCNLKILDVVSVPLPYDSRKNLHVSLVEIEEYLQSKCDEITDHQYSRNFGTPMKIYNYEGVNVTVKSTWNGGHYDINGICKGCKHFPCHEGLYDIFALPDHRVIGCRWSESSVEQNGFSFKDKLKNISKIFQRSDYIEREINDAMIPKPRFVVNSLKETTEADILNNDYTV